MDPERHFSANFDRQSGKVVKRVSDPAIGRVFEGHDPVVGVTGLDLFERGGDARHGDEVDRITKPLQGRQVAVGPGGTEVSHPKMLLNGPRSRDQLSEDRLQAIVGERSSVGVRHPLEHRLLTSGIVCLLSRRLLDVANLPGQFGPFIHQSDEIAVNPIDLRTEADQRGLPLAVIFSLGTGLRHGM